MFGYKGTLIHVVALYLTLLAVLGGVIGVGMDIAIEQLITLKRWVVELFDSDYCRVIVWICATLFGSTIAYLITNLVAPAAAGSGVSEMKVTLLGNYIPDLLTLRTLLTKIVGLVFVLGSGLWCGKVGPFIHIVSALAAQLTHIPIFTFIRDSKELFMQMLATAAGGGVSSNFGTAIGGLLFSVEVTGTYYPVRNYWFGTFNSVIAAFIHRSLSHIYHNSSAIFEGLFSLHYSFQTLKIVDGLISVVIGILSGVLAVVFIQCVSTVYKTRKYLRRFKLGRMPYVYLFLVALFTAVVTAPWFGNNAFGLSTNKTLELLFRNESIESSFSKPYLASLFILFVARYTITALSISLPVPAGLFATNMVIGSIFGRLCGEILEVMGISNELGPNGLAIVGGACFVGATTQTFSAAIVMIELVDNIQLIVPILISTVITISFSRLFSVGIYDRISIDKNLPHLPDIQFSSNQIAEHVMDRALHPIPECTNLLEVTEVVEQFRTDEEKNIPIVNTISLFVLLSIYHSPIGQGILLGQIKLSELRYILNASIPDSVAGKFMLDYRECPMVLLRNTPLSEVHMLFIASQVDSAFVTHNGRLVGEINKDCLAEAIAGQMKILV